MENKRAVVIAAIIALVVASVIVGVIILLTSLLRGRVSGPVVVTSTPAPVTSITSGSNPPAASQLSPTTSSNIKMVSVGGYTMSYPKQWGILKCSNSQSLEFDPSNGTDQLNVMCDYAVKPITILVSSNLGCPGEAATLGDSKVIRSKTVTTDGTDYRWCVFGTGSDYLDVTHRVSTSGSRATSKDDFSSQIEQIISTIRTGGAS